MSEINEKAYGERKSSLEHFTNNRNTLDGLYKSERYHLEPTFKSVQSVLDVGCAAGGGFQFSREANPSIDYTGIDISSNFIDLAKSTFPAGNFHSYDGYTIPLGDASVEMSFSIGVCHHLMHWKEMILEMLRVSSRYVVFDLRLTDKETLADPDKHFQKIAFDEKWDGVTKIPYLAINIDEAKAFFVELAAQNYVIDAYGYAGKPTELSVLPYDSVYMVSFCIEKDAGRGCVSYQIES